MNELKDIISNNQIDNKIQIWSCLLDQPEQVVSGFFSTLSSEEKKRAGKLKLTELRKRWIVSRGVLRLLLANYYNCSPQEIQLQYNEFGKPFVSSHLDGNEISFNLSHSYNLAVYIFAQNKRVGIDVEKIEELVDLKGLVDLCFSEYEKIWFKKVPANKIHEIFYRIWTSKEAYIKAIGKGFSFSPVKITLDQNYNQEMYFKEITGDNNFKIWKLVTFKPYPEFISSVVVEGDDITMEQFNVNPQLILE